ncbi:MAG: hypothetical protein KC583_02485, partial [Myxococcales bacterium]|nr:hypothetical protein [Myxococcales bacterium]
LITAVNGVDMMGAKTVPGAGDDPAAPTGVFPEDGAITVRVTGVGRGTVFPVLYRNGGDSTFLEIDDAGVPVELYSVGAPFGVFQPDTQPRAPRVVPVDGTATYVVEGLDDQQAYRVTLVVADNVVAPGDGSGVFVDGDANGAADAGASENIALITEVNGVAIAGAKTVPDGADDPADPTGVFPVDGRIVVVVTGVAAGTVYPVAYTNRGDSTFLEIDGDGVPTEPYSVGGAVSVSAGPVVRPEDTQTIAVSETVDYTITGLDDAQAYRVTLVIDTNVQRAPDGSGVFEDRDGNGAADSGPSDRVAWITMLNDAPVAAGTRTVPAGNDDPANPTGVFPVDGAIRITLTGVGAGTVYPVAYVNAGASTFLELDFDGVPTEAHGVGGAIDVRGPDVQPTGGRIIGVDASADYTIDGLDDDTAYRVTLVVSANVAVNADRSATFVDGDGNGAADAGPSENIGLITRVNGLAIDPGAKTVPGGDDDPAAPTGVFPVDGRITVRITGTGAGTLRPVAYANGGASTFLEIDGDGAPIERYGVGGTLRVVDAPLVEPAADRMVGVAATTNVRVRGLVDTRAYRITLVVADNITPAGDGTATFVDGDANGAADAGPSENVALITMINGLLVDPGAKTVPDGGDDPADPSGIFPVGGEITLQITGVGAGAVYPVVYSNGGASTFLEIDAGVPTELYGVGGAIIVPAP